MDVIKWQSNLGPYNFGLKSYLFPLHCPDRYKRLRILICLLSYPTCTKVHWGDNPCCQSQLPWLLPPGLTKSQNHKVVIEHFSSYLHGLFSLPRTLFWCSKLRCLALQVRPFCFPWNSASWTFSRKPFFSKDLWSLLIHHWCFWSSVIFTG